MLIAVASVLPIGGSLSGVIAFYVLLGATMALLMPAVQAASADRVTGPAAGQGRLAGDLGQRARQDMPEGPLLALPVLIAGWQGAFVAIGAAAIVMAVLCAALLDWRRPQGVARPGVPRGLHDRRTRPARCRYC